MLTKHLEAVSIKLTLNRRAVKYAVHLHTCMQFNPVQHVGQDYSISRDYSFSLTAIISALLIYTFLIVIVVLLHGFNLDVKAAG